MELEEEENGRKKFLIVYIIIINKYNRKVVAFLDKIWLILGFLVSEVPVQKCRKSEMSSIISTTGIISILSKMMEKIINEELLWNLKLNNLFHDRQFDIRQYRSQKIF